MQWLMCVYNTIMANVQCLLIFVMNIMCLKWYINDYFWYLLEIYSAIQYNDKYMMINAMVY